MALSVLLPRPRTERRDWRTLRPAIIDSAPVRAHLIPHDPPSRVLRVYDEDHHLISIGTDLTEDQRYLIIQGIYTTTNNGTND